MMVIKPSPEGEGAPKGRMRGKAAVAARKRVVSQGRPSSVTFGDSFSLRAKSRLRRLRSDTRLRAQPLGGSLYMEDKKS